MDVDVLGGGEGGAGAGVMVRRGTYTQSVQVMSVVGERRPVMRSRPVVG